MLLQRVVQNTIDKVLIWTGVSWVPLKYFPKAVNAGSGVKARPEALLNMFHRINAEAVDYKA